MRRNPIVFALLLSLAAHTTHAHFFYVEFDPENSAAVILRFGESMRDSTSENMQKIAAEMPVKDSEGTVLDFEPKEEFLIGSVDSSSSLVSGMLDYGVLDDSEDEGKKFMLKYYARASRDSGSAARSSDLPLDIVAKSQGDEIEFTITLHGEPVKGSNVAVETPDMAQPLDVVTDAAGRVTVSLPGTGPVGVLASTREPVTGAFEDVAYDHVRHYATATFAR